MTRGQAARSRDFRGPREPEPRDVSARTTARERLLALDAYSGVRQARRGTYASAGRGVNGESSN